MNATRSYQSTISTRLFQGALFSALSLATIEALHLWSAVETPSPRDHQLTLLYSVALILSLGISLAIFIKGLIKLIEWGREGVKADDQLLWSSWGALPVAIATLGICLTIALSMYPERDLINYNYSGYFWLIPSGAISAYAWYVTRKALYGLDQRFKGPWVVILSVTLTLAVPIATYYSASESIQNKVMSWPLIALILSPALMLLGFGLSWITPDRLGIDRFINRFALALYVLSLGAVLDLSEHASRHTQVKAGLLDHSLMSASIIYGIQPLFDRDGDGVAGKLGGADCDDQNPNVYPGAKEVPQNGIDEDCYGGDHIPPRRRVRRESVTNRARLGAMVERPNIILITIDTLRADHLHYQGYLRKTSPFLDALSQRGLTFEWAFSTGAQTRVSMPAVFTGRFYSEVSRSKGDWAEVYPDNLTLAERLRAAGYHTVGIPSHGYFRPNYGLHQGFEEWNLEVVERFTSRQAGAEGIEHRGTSYHITGSAVTDAALKWIEREKVSATNRQRPFFLWLHYFDPHHFYQDHLDINFRGNDRSPSQPVDLYDEEILYTDQQIERFFTQFERSQLSQNTYVMIHSDHGEGFGEHGDKYHGQSLFNNQVHVPLMLFGPQLPPHKIKTPVSLIDVTPTLLELAQVPALPPEPRGTSLLKFAYQPRADHHPIIIEMLQDSKHQSERRAIVDWPWKLHHSINFKKFKLFNLRKDPFENMELSTEGSSAFRRLYRRLNRFMSEEAQPLKPHNRPRRDR